MGVNGIYGLSGSGLDIDSMVKVGMLTKQREYDKMAQKFTKNEWTKTALLDVYSNINTFNMSTLSQYKMSVNMNAKTATTSNDAIKVTANASAANVNHKVTVDKLATNAQLISTTTDKDKFTITGDISFTLSDGTELSDGNKKEVTITLSADDNPTLTDLASAINRAGLNIKATYDVDNGVFSIYNTKSGEANTIKFSDLNGYTAQLFTDLGFKQSVDGELKGVTGVEHTTDTSGNITGMVENENAPFEFDTNGMIKDLSTPIAGRNAEVTGRNAEVNVDGRNYTFAENKFTAGGITYDITNATEGTTATVSVTQDVDGIVDRVKSFVEDYNKLLGKLYELYDEKPESGYSPLTQSQKDAMKEEQITKWEEKAKKGLLYHDRTLGSVINKLRSAISSKVEGISSINIDGKDKTYNSIFSLGVSTTGIKGQLTLDESKLRKALAEDPDAVYNIFAKLDSDYTDPSTGKKVERTTHNGVAQRLGDIFSNSLKTIRSRSGSSADIAEDSELNNLLRNLQTKMSNFKKMMDAFENKLYKKYDTMESMLAKLGSQMNYLMGGQQ